MYYLNTNIVQIVFKLKFIIKTIANLFKGNKFLKHEINFCVSKKKRTKKKKTVI